MSNQYTRTIAHLDKMILEAQRDFPGLPRDDIEFVIYCGTSRDKTTGIEFRPEGEIPPMYRNEAKGLEFRY
jgi:hypothetical protein